MRTHPIKPCFLALVCMFALGCGQEQSGWTESAMPVRFPGTSGPLSVTSMQPSHGLIAIRTIVSIKGTGFKPGTSVAIDGQPCKWVVVVNEKHLACIAQPHAGGTVDVTVSNADGTNATATGAFTYHRLGDRPET